LNADEESLAAERVSGYGVGQAALEVFHRSRARTAIEAGVDLLAFETIPDLVEARAIVVRKKPFVSHCYVRAVDLPRQARDKHGES